MTRYVVLDTETTGTVPERDRVVWVAAAIVEDRNVTQRWSTFLDPGPNSRVRVAGIDLAGQPTFADVALRLTDMLQDGVLVAHNAPFDVAFLVAECSLAQAFPSWTRSPKGVILQPPKPEIRPSSLVLERVLDRDADMEAGD